jgi:hypothetical protein
LRIASLRPTLTKVWGLYGRTEISTNVQCKRENEENAPLELDEVNQLLSGVDAGSTVGSGGEDGGNVNLGVGLGRDGAVVELDSVGSGGGSGHFWW